MRDNATERGVSIGRDQNQFVSLIVNITDLAGLLLPEVLHIGFLEYVHCAASWLGPERSLSPWQGRALQNQRFLRMSWSISSTEWGTIPKLAKPVISGVDTLSICISST
jgi:hypothetical protein